MIEALRKKRKEKGGLARTKSDGRQEEHHHLKDPLRLLYLCCIITLTFGVDFRPALSKMKVTLPP
jgi:hypothetical protein